MKILSVFIVSLVLSACSVSNYEIKGAEYMCKDHGGVAKVDNTIFMSVLCVDGSVWLYKSSNLKGIGVDTHERTE